MIYYDNLYYMICYVMLCYVMLCYVMLCYVIFYPNVYILIASYCINIIYKKNTYLSNIRALLFLIYNIIKQLF